MIDGYNTPNRDLGIEFVKFLLGPEGQEIMISNDHPTIFPAIADNLRSLLFNALIAESRKAGSGLKCYP